MINCKQKASSKMEQGLLKTVFFLVINLLIISSYSFAQKGSKSLHITTDGIIPSAQESVGFGLSLKGLYGISEYGELTVSVGATKFKMKNLDEACETKVRFIPFLVGYRLKIQKLYIEPKVGIGELGGRILLLCGSDYSRPSVTAAFGGIEASFNLKRFSVGFNFLATRGILNSSAGTWYNKDFHYTSISVNYILLKKTTH